MAGIFDWLAALLGTDQYGTTIKNPVITYNQGSGVLPQGSGYQISALPGYTYPTPQNTASSNFKPWFNQLMTQLQSYAKQQKAAQAALQLPSWVSALYPQLGGMDQNDLAQFMTIASSLGLPAGWGGSGSDSSLGYAQLAESAKEFAQQFPETVRQFDLNYGLNQNAQNFNQDYQNRTLAQQIAEANTASNQWNRNFDFTKDQALWQRGFDTEQANRAANQWDQTFALNKQNQDWTQAIGNRQQTQSENNDAFSQAMQQWSNALAQAQLGMTEEQNKEQNKITREGQALAATGRRFAPSVTAM